jgi:protein-histidine pros-kinase
VFSWVAALFPAYSCRRTALNPTNTDDRPGPFEVELTDRFKVNVGLDELSGVRAVSDQTMFNLARPIRVEDPRCLACHSSPDKAPPGMVAEYGYSNGFGWALHDVVGVQLLTVRAAWRHGIGDRRRRGGLLLVFGLTYFTLTSALDAVVVRPLRRLAEAAEAVSVGADPTDLPTGSAGEVGRVAEAILRLRRSLDNALRRAAAVVRESATTASEKQQAQHG